MWARCHFGGLASAIGCTPKSSICKGWHSSSDRCRTPLKRWTWSGIIGGWLLTMIITYIFIILFKEIEFYLLFFSIFISIFSQFGDLYESFLKRNAGIKDSSNLIPGHGGFLDRFDGMIGAFFAVFIINFININNWIF